MSADGSRLLRFADGGAGLLLLDGQSEKEVARLQGLQAPLLTHCLAFSPDGKRLTACGKVTERGTAQREKKILKVWDAVAGRELFSRDQDDVERTAFSPDGRRLAVAAGRAVVLDAATGKEQRSFPGHAGSLAFSPDGNQLAVTIQVAFQGWQVTVLDLVGEKPPARLGSPVAAATCLAFSPNGRFLACGDGSTVQVWGSDGTPLHQLQGHTAPVRAVVFSPDSKWIATGSGDRTVRLWGMDGRCLRTYRGHTGEVSHVAFQPDGQHLISRGGQTLNVWDVRREPGILSLSEVDAPAAPPSAPMAGCWRLPAASA
jgi:WD40 repeat protein